MKCLEQQIVPVQEKKGNIIGKANNMIHNANIRVDGSDMYRSGSNKPESEFRWRQFLLKFFSAM